MKEEKPTNKPMMRIPIMNMAGGLIQAGLVQRIVQHLKAQKTGAVALGGAGRSRNLYWESNGYGSGHFKRNRRKELAISRRRRMKCSAR